jgi:tRNA(Ile)-lysidine synthase
LQGLRGIASRRQLTPDVTVVRPLLSVTRAEVMAYLREVGQEFRHDRSNDDLRYTRNRIRHELLPLLRDRYNPRIAQALTRLAVQAEEARADTEARAADLLGRAELPRAGGLLVFDLDRLHQGPPALVREVFRLVWAREGWPMGRMGHEAWGRVAEAVFGGTRAVDLPGHVHVRRRGRVIQAGRKDPG